ncbi:MAG: acetyl-CoA carboxylase biotin carboxylase subunit [Oenococcus sp.]|uniref:acetyl-CoA carboxylase biotin carboxylase subunit n=1 Tax=Oenococcus sp. TaxID=1979414 RepID=UPI0039E82C1C
MKKVLIANRGEIAVRIIRACRLLNIATVAVYSTADRSALHVQLADQAVCIGPADVQHSYLNQASIIVAAEMTGADAIHPGYGFLSENAEFAQACQDAGIKFIGPGAKVIATMGEKSAARKTMIAAGVPVVPGSGNEFTTLAQGTAAAEQIGYPIMLKASAGGGGKGMRVVDSPEVFGRLFSLTQSEAEHAFGDNHMYLEKYLAHPRHIEIQIAADQFGNAIAVGERDCTIQQHHQKVLEEAPAIALDEASRQKMFQISVTAAKAIHYEGVGTLEFLFDGPDHFYFMEMNTRIQVEHPITELTSGLDLVDLQLKIADGKPLAITQADVSRHGFALECRVTARTAGKIKLLHLPGGHGIRVDDALYQGYTVPANYDAMIAKVIAFGPDRQSVIREMQMAIDEIVIDGIQTNLDFLMQLLSEKAFQANQTDINWLDQLTETK